MNIWWSPGQSDAVQLIVGQLDRREKTILASLSFLFGVCCFTAVMLVMGLATGAGPFPQSLSGFALPLGICLAACAVAAIVLQRRLLLRTRVARENGFTMADLTARQPLSRTMSRSDYLRVGSIAALAVAIGLGSVLASFWIAA